MLTERMVYMRMVKVSVLTPTYNRKNTLPRLVDSLKKQTRQDFQWLVIDDGSTDETENYFDSLKNANLMFEWEYHKKENGGKHTALNFAHPYIKGDVVLILDSDDYLTEDAIETLEKEWSHYMGISSDIGIINYFKGFEDGTHLSIEHKNDFYIDDDIHYRVNHRIKGDRCEVVRADIFKRYPFPVYDGENFFSESWLWNKIAMNYKTVYRNKTIYICEYLEGGLSEGGRALRMRSPLGMMDDCRSYLNKEVCVPVRIKEMLLYWVYARCARYSVVKTMQTSGRYLGMLLTLIPGIVIYYCWRYKFLALKQKN